ncbi:hypothetical protein C0Q70_13320 [Pomacea canaliculata]|uniref:Sushi domain-containing protein n=1 Tax=Pomacea canaliculata TaxID=400727 RepID=A0A2T7NWW0_POMCA|nr:hypothetical protein C0Q70_13320 [Pomacea canaliculata]
MSLTLLLPSEREDVMGKYWFMNRYQCERLCWYRKLCKTYSYIYNRTLATDGNCVLHADNISTNTTSGVSTAWIEREAFWDTELQDNGCRSRPCNETQVCVPTFDPPFYTCLPFPAECQAPSRDDGVYSDVTLLQGQRTNFTCSSSRHADNTVTCQVNGKYSDPKGNCKIAIYHSPVKAFPSMPRYQKSSEKDGRLVSKIIFKNITTFQINLGSNNINMTGATYLEIIRDVRLTYVDLGKGCE